MSKAGKISSGIGTLTRTPLSSFTSTTNRTFAIVLIVPKWSNAIVSCGGWGVGGLGGVTGGDGVVAGVDSGVDVERGVGSDGVAGGVEVCSGVEKITFGGGGGGVRQE